MKTYAKNMCSSLLFILISFAPIRAASEDLDIAEQEEVDQQQALDADTQRRQQRDELLQEIKALGQALRAKYPVNPDEPDKRRLVSIRESVPPLADAMNQQLQYNFSQAKAQANALTRNDVDTDLRSIGPWNKDLVWDTSKTHILVTSWMPLDIMRDKYLTGLRGIQKTTTYPNVYMWVTPTPVAQLFAASYDSLQNNGLPLHYRLNQLFGLSHDTRAKHFVELWVKPEDIRRSCANSETTGSSCIYDENRFNPTGTQKNYPAYQDIYTILSDKPDHQAWYRKQLQDLTKPGNNFPWTGLGYTFDWGNKSGDYAIIPDMYDINEDFSDVDIEKEHRRNVVPNRGETEFMIKQGATVYIERIIPTDGYGRTPKIKSNQRTLPFNLQEDEDEE